MNSRENNQMFTNLLMMKKLQSKKLTKKGEYGLCPG